MKGVVLGGTQSGVGKTVAALAVMRALEAAGHKVQPAKAGPDFIDPSHHRAVLDRPSRTLDVWLEGEEGVRRNYHRGEGDVCVVEGVMGLYDGDGSSTAMVAEALDLPVVLVVDAAAGMESVAATALGFQRYADRIGRDIDVEGVLVQRAHGGRHAEGIREALPESLTYLGRIPPDERLEIPDRHLGLEMGPEAPLPEAALEEAAETVQTDRIAALAREPESVVEPDPDPPVDRPRIAVARDEAFAFLYPAVLERLRDRADVVTISPVSGDSLPAVDGIYLPGGYPELHADSLADGGTLEAVAERAADGIPVYGECGGFMALCQSLTTAEGDRYAMAGVLPADVDMCDRYQALDHVALRATRDVPVAAPGSSVRGHEFHYSSASVDRDARFAFEVERGDGIDGSHDGLVSRRVLGTYCHTHVNSGVFDAFVDAAWSGV